jgi:hypothetical protein
MSSLAAFLLKAITFLPRKALAAVAHEALKGLAAEVEGATTNQIVEGAEAVGFGDLDALLARIIVGD